LSQSISELEKASLRRAILTSSVGINIQNAESGQAARKSRRSSRRSS
jgi:hypothetical protein